MDLKSPKSVTIQEYLLYAGIIMQAVLIAVLFRIGSAIPIVGDMKIYFGFTFVVGLASAFFQLNRLHRKRKEQQAAQEMEQRVQRAEPPSEQPSRRILGLTLAQLVIILVVFVGALAAFSWSLSSLHLGTGN
jgi:hypothetical protein